MNFPTRRPILLILLLAPALLLIHFTHRYLHPIQTNPHNLTQSISQAPLCFIYDRPGGTGSSTMTFALRACILDRHRFSEVPDSMKRTRNDQIEPLLRNDSFGRLRAVVSAHMRFAGRDVEMLRRECGELLYVTSARRMKERLWSVAKYNQLRVEKVGFDVRGFGTLNLVNGSLTKAQYERARSGAVSSLQSFEDSLEKHPYLEVSNQESLMGDGERLVPDYVVRNIGKGQYNEDLGRLLEALGCENSFRSSNRHESSFGGAAKGIPNYWLRFGDALFKRLLRIGNVGNEEGLKRARRFVALVRDLNNS